MCDDMISSENQHTPPPQSTREGRRLTVLYIFALSTVAILSIGAQWLIQRQLDNGENDSKVINIAGRQRMLSQRLAKTALQLVHADESSWEQTHTALKATLKEWTENHTALKDGSPDRQLPGNNSHAIELLFDKIEPHFSAMKMAATTLTHTSFGSDSISSSVDIILDHEGHFLEGMDQIVSQYVVEAEAKVTYLRRLETALLALTLLVLAAEGTLIFRPAVKRIEHTVASLAQATERLTHARDEAESANTAKSRFLANVSHELRTPMTAVLGMTELARHTDDTNKRDEYLDIIDKSGHSLLALLNDLIDLAAIDANQLKLINEAFDPRALGQRLVAMMQPIATDKRLQLAYHDHSTYRGLVAGDESRVQQVLLNLLSNAIKCTAQGGVSLTFTDHATSPTQIELCWKTSDTGPGMAAADQQRVFEAFTQLPDEKGKLRGGVGLGLSICRRIADAIGGELSLESQLGTGTDVTFRVRFQTTSTQEAPPSSQQYIHTKPLHILVVEDTELNQILFRELLEREGHSVEVADTGEASLELFAAGQFDCALIDLQLPGINGIEVGREMAKAEANGNRRTPQICVTADASQETLSDFDVVLAKPFTRVSLLKAIAMATGKQEEMNNQELPDTDPELLRELAATYLKVSELQTESLTQAIDDKRLEDARLVSHRMRGQIGYFTTGPIIDLLLSFEKACKSNNLEEATNHLPQVLRQLANLHSELRQQYPQP